MVPEGLPTVRERTDLRSRLYKSRAVDLRLRSVLPSLMMDRHDNDTVRELAVKLCDAVHAYPEWILKSEHLRSATFELETGVSTITRDLA